ncbi:YqgE/AlgH family protein [Marmoricola sp. RAF53]|uniref:YqgE/AlgH family protein n=1 Tax=Marmoricola sp. RAF53 TaxID=3233059 RepID=UPI003F9BFE5D
MDPAPGRLLVASPTLADPNFARTIVLLLDAGDDGALGVVLNRPTSLEVAEVLAGWDSVVDGPGVLFQGGPVETDSALGVASVAGTDSEDGEPLGWRRVFGSTGLVDLDAPIELMAEAVSALRIFAGYAGWSAGQLEDEIAEGAWYVVAAEPEDPFRVDPSDLWAEVLRRQGGVLAMMATMPVEPGLN